MASQSPEQASPRKRVTQHWWLGSLWAVVGALLALGGFAGYRLNGFRQGQSRGFIKNGDPTRTTIAIEATAFEMGDGDGEPDEAPPHRVPIDAFHIDEREVTVAEYQACVEAGVCPVAHTDLLYCNAKLPDRQTHPINCVTLRMAEVYCRWRGARLPSEAEWELAARGKDGRSYPWGGESPLDRACFLRRKDNLQTCPVGSLAADKSPYGVLDMAGNVSEWTSSAYCSYSDPTRCQPGVHVVRGGSWDMDDPRHARVSFRDWVEDDKHGYNLGFRCAQG